MSDFTTTPRLGLKKPTENSDDDLWGGHINENFDVLDTAQPAAHTHPISDVTGLQSTLDAIQADIDTHEADTNNPHQVTAAQVGALTQAQADLRYLLLAGGVMTGLLTLSGDATAALGAVTKQQLDTGLAAKLSDAPADGSYYTRRNNAWAVAPGGMTDAPSDGFGYGRFNAAWARVLMLTGGVLSGNLGLPSGGTAAAPTLWFGATNNGIFSNAGTTLQFSANGAVRWTVGGTVLTATVPIRGAAGSAAAPTFSFAADTATGFYQPSVNTIALSVGGADVATATAGKAVSFMGAVTLAQDATLAFQAVTFQQLNAKAATYLPLAGGTLTGALTLSGNATLPLQAVTLQQLQAATAGGFLPLTGGSITGTPGALAVGSTLPADAAPGTLLGGNFAGGAITFNAYGANGPTWKTRAAGYSAYETFDAAGGGLGWWIAPSVAAGAVASPALKMGLSAKGHLMLGMTEPASIAPSIAAGGVLSCWYATMANLFFQSYWDGTNNRRLSASASPAMIFPSAGGYIFYGALAGALDSTFAWNNLASIDGTGNLTAASNIISGGRVYCGNGVSPSPYNSNEWVLYTDASGNQFNSRRANWYEYWQSSDGLRAWASPNGWIATLDGAGSFWAKGNIQAAGNVTAAWLHSTGDMSVDGQIYTTAVNASQGIFQIAPNYYMRRDTNGDWIFVEGGTINGRIGTNGYVSARAGLEAPYVHSTGDMAAANAIYAPLGFHATGTYGEFSLWDNGDGYRTLSFSNSGAWKWLWNKSNGDLYWQAGGVNLWIMRRSDNLVYNPSGTVGGNGAYSNISDTRLKENVAPFHAGLPEILKLNPIIFNRIGKDGVEAGFGAQEVQAAIPLAVAPIGVLLPDGTGGLDDDNPTLAVQDMPIVAALVNAVKTIEARLRALEGKTQ